MNVISGGGRIYNTVSYTTYPIRETSRFVNVAVARAWVRACDRRLSSPWDWWTTTTTTNFLTKSFSAVRRRCFYCVTYLHKIHLYINIMRIHAQIAGSQISNYNPRKIYSFLVVWGRSLPPNGIGIENYNTLINTIMYRIVVLV